MKKKDTVPAAYKAFSGQDPESEKRKEQKAKDKRKGQEGKKMEAEGFGKEPKGGRKEPGAENTQRKPQGGRKEHEPENTQREPKGGGKKQEAVNKGTKPEDKGKKVDKVKTDKAKADKAKVDKVKTDKAKADKAEPNKPKPEKEKPEKQKPEKEQRRKPKYGLFSCVAYIYGILWKSERALVFVGFLTVPIALGMAALNLYTTPIIIRYLEQSGGFSTVALVIMGLIFLQLVLALTDGWLEQKIFYAEHYVIGELCCLHEKVFREMDFYLGYEPDVRVLKRRADASVSNNHTAAVHFPMDFANMVGILLKFVLFGSVISILSPWIILLLVVGCLINYFLSRWEQKRNFATADKRWKIEKKVNYISIRLSRDTHYGKDIRLYSFRDYLQLLAEKLSGEYRIQTEWVERRGFMTALGNFLVVLVRDGAVYLFLISRIVSGQIDAPQFLLYFSAITGLAGVITDILGKWSGIFAGAMGVSDFREFVEVRGKLNKGKGIDLPKGAFSVEFRDVSYRYPQGDKNVLEHISFRVEPGEKIALVGANGAGKTTLIRLMCGLLLPTEGEVLIDGHGILEYNRDELYGLFGLVPQNYNLLPTSIARNVSCTKDKEDYDMDKVARCLALAGLEEKVRSLPLGADTPLNRQVNPEGVELSGGEAQKLLLARLLYRHPGCIILDEPTAALDPIAEDKMYRKYNEITKDSTSVFISHRLASTRFCDRIFLLDGAKFTESGTHEELMESGKKYRELFDLQSRYYKENVDGLSETEAAV